jgi:hypothetical protein
MKEEGLLQIYGQAWEHAPAIIVGSADGLRRLAALLLRAADSDPRACVQEKWFYPADGEGYRIYAMRATKKELEGVARQYHDNGIEPNDEEKDALVRLIFGNEK